MYVHKKNIKEHQKNGFTTNFESYPQKGCTNQNPFYQTNNVQIFDDKCNFKLSDENYKVALDQKLTKNDSLSYYRPRSSTYLNLRSSKSLILNRWFSNTSIKNNQNNSNNNDDDSKDPKNDNSFTPNNNNTNTQLIKLNKDNKISKPKIPEQYKEVLTLPISKRPLYPGFYKAILIKDANVIKAIKYLVKRKEPYIGAFMLKDDNLDTDMVKHKDEVHEIGVFAQITSVFPANLEPSLVEKEDYTAEQYENSDEIGKNSNALTVVLYPHRRILLKNIYRAKKDQSINNTKKEKNIKDNNPDETLENNNCESPASALLKGRHDVAISKVENCMIEPYKKNDPIIKAITTEIVSIFKEIATMNTFFRDQIASFSMSHYSGNVFDEPGKLADFAAAVCGAGEPQEFQEILGCLNIPTRLQKALILLKKELMNAELQRKISREVDEKIARRQREYYLMEQLKGIKRELGLESDGKEKLIEMFKERAKKLKMPNDVQKVFDEEINKLNMIETASSEFNVSRNYLDWLTMLPWGQFSKENYNIDSARKILDEDHYGLEDVKQRILEFIAVGRLKGSVEGKIICLVGPPGVGKTSIGKSIARALNREFFRFSVGGLTDVAEIKGHRRTYIGAMPGKMIQALKKVQKENPLVLIDEIDKIGTMHHHGDPSSALLELLDPEQNSAFMDHYMDVAIDLSKVLFVCTCNTLDTIPQPLLDRMEVIELSGYILEEKMSISNQYLIPQTIKNNGLENANIKIEEEALSELIKSYCRENGVRSLKKIIDKIYRKIAFKMVSNNDTINTKEDKQKQPEGTITEEERNKVLKESSFEFCINSKNLKDLVGPPIFVSDKLYEDNTPPGVIMGLAWTSMGGSSIYIESVIKNRITKDSEPSFTQTGQLGDVMKESSLLAYTMARNYIARNYPENRFFDKAAIHMHVPEGATPKDGINIIIQIGPSAGITMTSALLSLALNRAVKPSIAMTGEISVTGKVLKIGGVKEKTIAAKRAGIKTVILPKNNYAEWSELQDYIKKDISPIFVDHFDEIPEHIRLTEDNRKREWLDEDPVIEK